MIAIFSTFNIESILIPETFNNDCKTLNPDLSTITTSKLLNVIYI